MRFALVLGLLLIAGCGRVGMVKTCDTAKDGYKSCAHTATATVTWKTDAACVGSCR